MGNSPKPQKDIRSPTPNPLQNRSLKKEVVMQKLKKNKMFLKGRRKEEEVIILKTVLCTPGNANNQRLLKKRGRAMSPMNCGTCKKPTWRQWGVLAKAKAQDPRLQNDDKVTIQNDEAESEQNSRDTNEQQRFQQCRGAMGMDWVNVWGNGQPIKRAISE